MRAQELGVNTGLKEPLLTKMCEANATFQRWQGTAEMRKQAKEEWVRSTAQAEKSASKVAPPPEQELAEEPLATESPSEAHESMSSAGQKKKVSLMYNFVQQ